VVRHIADRVAVMYWARSSRSHRRTPLRGATPSVHRGPPVGRARAGRPEGASRRRIILKGDIPSPSNPPEGCRFHTRCWLREKLGNPEVCATDDPRWRPSPSEHRTSSWPAISPPRCRRSGRRT
jgi:oligopeptide/dipeptide ABC transporter ATP-binding protein